MIHGEKVFSYRMAFGSCFNHQRQYKSSKIFDSVLMDRPDSFVWLGDFTYLDDLKVVNGKRQFEYIEPKLAVKRFEKSYNDPYYKKVRESTKIYGIWDDHDSGINDSDKTNFRKEMYRQMFLDYIDEPKDSLRRRRLGGMYESYYLDDQKLIKLILLDVRYDRDAVTDESILFEEKSLLGKEQEEWVRKEVLESEAHFTLIAMGNQFIPDDRPMIEVVFPKTRDFLLTLHNPKTVQIIISGDVHFGEAMVENCAKHFHGYPLHEFTSSGLSHSIADLSKIYKLDTDTILSFIFPDTYSTPADRFTGLNYATLDFIIDPEDPSKSHLDFRLKDIRGNTVVRRQLSRQKDLIPAAIPDKEAFEKCRKARGNPKLRKYLNMGKKLIDPRSILFYILLSILAGMAGILWLAMRCVATVSRLRLKLSQVTKPKSQ